MIKFSVLALALLSAASVGAQTPVNAPIRPTTATPSTQSNPTSSANSATTNTVAPTPAITSTLTTPSRPDAVSAPNSSTSNASPADSNGVVPPATTLIQTAPAATSNNQQVVSQGVQTYAADGQGVANLNSMDANGDSMLSKQEYLSHYERQFSGMKKNIVGLVDLRRVAENGQQ